MSHETTYPGQPSMAWYREPAAWVAIVVAVLSVIASFNFSWLNEDQKILWIALVDAIAALVTALKVRPFAPTLVTYLITAGFAVAMAYGAQVPDGLVAAINSGVVMVVFAVTRHQQSPRADFKPEQKI